MPSSNTRSNAYRDSDAFQSSNALTWLFLYRLVLAALLASRVSRQERNAAVEV